MGKQGAGSKQERKMAINQERVNVVCNELAEAGQKVTLAAVREALREGSFSTIGPMVQRWKAGRGDVVASGATGAGAVVVPDAIQAAGGRMMAEVWAIAERMAAERLAAERAAMDAERATRAAELEAAYGDLESLREELAAEKALVQEAAERVKAAESTARETEARWQKTCLSLERATAEAAAYKLAIEKFTPHALQQQPKKPAPGKKAGRPIAKSNAGPVDTRTAPLVL